MKPPAAKATLVLKKGKELALSGTDLAEILRKVLDKGVPARFKARGVSMSPLIKDGDVLTVYPSRNITSALGHVVVYLDPHTRQLVVHRIIGKKRGKYLLRGDSALISNSLVLQANILGMVHKVERNGKKRRFGNGPERILLGLFFRFNFLPRFMVTFRNRIHLLPRKPAA